MYKIVYLFNSKEFFYPYYSCSMIVLGVISESAKGWRKEPNKISWNGAEPKYDLRDWAPDHEKMGKGITLSADEAQELYKILGKIVEA